MRGFIGSHRLRLASVAALFLTWGLFQFTSGAPLTKPTPEASEITRAVRLMMKNHLSKRQLDDEISRRAMKSFLQSFDPRKMYFYQSDVDQFMEKNTLLDDEINKNKVDFAYVVFNRFLERLDERVKLVDELVTLPTDFTVDEELVVEPDLLHYPRDAAEARERWRKLVKYNLLTMKADKVDDKEARAKISRR